MRKSLLGRGNNVLLTCLGNSKVEGFCWCTWDGVMVLTKEAKRRERGTVMQSLRARLSI